MKGWHVHDAQVAHFRTKREVADEARLQASLNGLLPPDIRVLEMRRYLPLASSYWDDGRRLRDNDWTVS
eukprot:scaffold5337_cov411-Prasinococcus_capsulatus_cf.AAC.16